MKRLNFMLKTNGKIIIDKELNYFINDNKMNFIDADTAYKILLNDKIFMKKNKESLIKFDFKKKKAYIKLLEENLDFEMQLKKYKYILKDNNLLIEYILDDGENTLNNIVIYY